MKISQYIPHMLLTAAAFDLIVYVMFYAEGWSPGLRFAAGLGALGVAQFLGATLDALRDVAEALREKKR